MSPFDLWVEGLLLESLEEILTPADEWRDWWEDQDDPIGPDDPDDYLSEADE